MNVKDSSSESEYDEVEKEFDGPDQIIKIVKKEEVLRRYMIFEK